ESAASEGITNQFDIKVIPSFVHPRNNVLTTWSWEFGRICTSCFIFFAFPSTVGFVDSCFEWHINTNITRLQYASTALGNKSDLGTNMFTSLQKWRLFMALKMVAICKQLKLKY